MTKDTLRTMLTRQPFEPLRVKMSSGEVFEIKYPKMAMLTKSGLVITLPEPDGSPSDRVEYCSYLHIAGVETVAFA